MVYLNCSNQGRIVSPYGVFEPGATITGKIPKAVIEAWEQDGLIELGPDPDEVNDLESEINDPSVAAAMVDLNDAHSGALNDDGELIEGGDVVPPKKFGKGKK